MHALPILLLIAVLAAPSSPASSVRHWRGTLGPADDRRAFSLTLSGVDSLTGWLDLPESGLVGEPLGRAAQRGDSVAFVLTTDLGDLALMGRLTGEHLDGVAHMGPLALPFGLVRVPDAPRRPAGEDVTFANGDIRLAGTFFTAGSGLRPAVVLVHGSGAQTRLSIGDRARVQAWLDAGTSVLVFDKRGVGASGGDLR